MVLGGISHGVTSQLIMIACNLTAVRYRDEVMWRLLRVCTICLNYRKLRLSVL